MMNLFMFGYNYSKYKRSATRIIVKSHRVAIFFEGVKKPNFEFM